MILSLVAGVLAERFVTTAATCAFRVVLGGWRGVAGTSGAVVGTAIVGVGAGGGADMTTVVGAGPGTARM